MQKIHYVTLLYAIKFHNVQRNVSKVNTFDEPYRNLEKSKRWHLYSWCLIQVNHMESPTRWPYGVSNKMSIWSLQQDDHMESPTRRPYGVSNKTIIWSIQQVDHMESPTRRPHWVSHKKECQVLQHFKADEFFPIHRRGEIEQNASKIFN